MDAQKIIDYFGADQPSASAKAEATAQALGMTRQGVLLWLKSGIPGKRQAQIAELTRYKFKPDKRPWE